MPLSCGQFIRDNTGLYLSEGRKYRGNGHQFIRMNIACPTDQLENGLRRLLQGVKEYEGRVARQC